MARDAGQANVMGKGADFHSQEPNVRLGLVQRVVPCISAGIELVRI